MFALTEERGLVLLRFEDERFELGGFVGAVAEGLLLGKSTGTPGVILTSFQFHLCWKFRGDVRFGHVHSLSSDSVVPCYSFSADKHNLSSENAVTG